MAFYVRCGVFSDWWKPNNSDSYISNRHCLMVGDGREHESMICLGVPYVAEKDLYLSN